MDKIQYKKCNVCGLEKEIEQFYKLSRNFINPRVNKDKHETLCKSCKQEKQNKSRWKNKDWFNKYNREYAKQNPEKRKRIMQKYQASPKGIYRNLMTRGKERVIISQQDFIKWYESQEKQCFYSDIPETQVAKFAKGKLRKRLTIDKVNPKGNYAEDNMVLACGICNMVKNDIFTQEEMLTIGKIIKKKWSIYADC
jgi:hypothetical protein